ncbi:MAG TPA: ACT domain-containing protein [Alphaproteobacteria bacterium]|nr:ACT domain-containing protein [Alphaproteobacteria bacterium]
MTAFLILTAIGKDRPGLVSALSEEIAAHGGNWLESRMARLAGEFAGIVRVSVPAANAEALVAALRGLEARGLRVTVERGVGEVPATVRAGFKLELMGQDHPGIIRDVTHALAALGVNIEELTTEIESGSMSGTALFRASARLSAPAQVKAAELRESLERLAGDLMVEISLDEAPAAGGGGT